MLFIYFRDSLRKIELPTATRVASDPSDSSLSAILDASDNVEARVRDDDIATISRIDLGPNLQVTASDGSAAQGLTLAREHQQAAEFTGSSEAQIPE